MGITPGTRTFGAFSMFLRPAQLYPACTALPRAEWSVWPSQMHFVPAGGAGRGRSSTRLSVTLLSRRNNHRMARVNGSHPRPLFPEYEQDTQKLLSLLWTPSFSCTRQNCKNKKRTATICCTIAFVIDATPSPRVAQV